MAGTDLAQRTQQTVALIDHPQFLEQVEALLPDDLPVRRFVQVAKTAIRSTPELVEADQNTLFAAIIRCAQDGLYPDKHEAVLNVYGGKVTYLPMVAGVIRAARDYGWLMHAEAVHENDEFEWRGSDEKPYHRHPRPGETRGDLVAAFAYATHGAETMAVVLYQDDIQKRRAKAQTDKVWKEWPEAMYRKSAAHALYRKLPRSERDRDNRFDETTLEPAAAVELLYGPDGATFATTPAPPLDAAEPPEAAGTGGTSQQAEPTPPSSVGSAPGDEDDPEPQPAAKPDYGATIVPSGAYADMTLAAVADLGEDGEKWLTWAARNKGRFDEDFATFLLAFIDEQLKAAA
jgi:recombination protein RecT